MSPRSWSMNSRHSSQKDNGHPLLNIHLMTRRIDKGSNAHLFARHQCCEIRYGLERLPPGKKKRDLEMKIKSVLKVLPVEPVTDAVAEEYGRLKRALELQGISLQDNDLWIACAAKILGATLVSR